VSLEIELMDAKRCSGRAHGQLRTVCSKRPGVFREMGGLKVRMLAVEKPLNAEARKGNAEARAEEGD
jgi:hypothetical protein